MANLICFLLMLPLISSQGYLGFGPESAVFGPILIWVFFIFIAILGAFAYPFQKLMAVIRKKKKPSCEKS